MEGLAAGVKQDGIASRCADTIRQNEACGLSAGREARWWQGVRARCLTCILIASTAMWVFMRWSLAIAIVAAVDALRGRPRQIRSAWACTLCIVRRLVVLALVNAGKLYRKKPRKSTLYNRSIALVDIPQVFPAKNFKR